MEQILSTKLFIPPARPKLVSRPRLIQQLNEGLTEGPSVILLSAPAGFGKTTLVSQWLAHLEVPAAWLSLDGDDNDFARFWTYFIAALQTVQPQIGAGLLDLLHSSPLPNSHAFLTLLINDLISLSEDILLVLDDYHVIQTPAIDEALTFLIDHIPPNIHLLISGRADPELPLARLRARRQLYELPGPDLSFTRSETSQFLEQVTGLRLAPSDIALLNEHIEGWIAGLQMAALALSQRESVIVPHFIQDFTGSHRYIMDYLVDEVLQQQPPEVQTFLLYTSILDQFCAPLCEVLFQEVLPPEYDRNSASPAITFDARKVRELLEYLERANLFVNPLDDQRHWYRYHHLFADLLRHRLGQIYPNRVASLHLRASQWYEKTGRIDPAVRHALAANAFAQAAKLLEQIAPLMLQRSELARLLTWLGTLPEVEIQARPLLGLYFCWGLLLGGKTKQAAARLESVQSRLEAEKESSTSDVQGHVAALRAYLMRETGNLDSTVVLSRQALAQLPEQDMLLRAMGKLNLAIAYYLQGELESAHPLLTEIITTGHSAQLIANTMSAIYLKTRVLRAQGSLQQALQLCQQGLELVTRHGWEIFPAVGFVYGAFSELLREQNELSKATEYLERSRELGEAGDHPHIMILSHVWSAWLQQTQADLAGSHESIQTALQLVEDRQVSRFWPLPCADCYQVRLWIAQGILAGAKRWAQTRGLNHADAPVSFLYESENLTLVRVWIAENKLNDAESLLGRLYQETKSAARTGSLIEVLILQAIVFSTQDRGDEALSSLEQALDLAEPEGFVRIFLDEGASIVELLRRSVAQGIHVSYALRLLNAVEDSATVPQPLILPLSERELEVLRRIAAGYSNQEIAQDLVVAVSTVKKHINNMYRKLGVGSRTRAVAKARELGLL